MSLSQSVRSNVWGNVIAHRESVECIFQVSCSRRASSNNPVNGYSFNVFVWFFDVSLFPKPKYWEILCAASEDDAGWKVRSSKTSTNWLVTLLHSAPGSDSMDFPPQFGARQFAIGLRENSDIIQLTSSDCNINRANDSNSVFAWLTVSFVPCPIDSND